ncbi:hypothetical protein J3R83DRAFT_4874 [Lanmaoa asiatica]|nr:hypothetical protein J3R83DRAFT_4874 [Lanmaoa asiatica]
MAANDTDGNHTTVTRPLSAGIYAPIPTFFKPESEDLDLDVFEKHVLRTALAGVRPLLSGSMGEAIHLSHAERSTLIKIARKVLDNAGLDRVPIISGIGAGSTRECIELANEAADAGADYTIAICSGYFAGALAGNKKALRAFWTEISQKSPIPVIIYNYPGAAGGINLDSDLITELAVECPNLAGVKLTCGDDAPFLVLGGFADFLLPGACANGHGAITGLANVAPLSEGSKTDPKLLGEAQILQGIVARADATIAKSSIAGTKSLLDRLHGYGGNPRRPLAPIEPAAGEALWEHAHTRALVDVELSLANAS